MKKACKNNKKMPRVFKLKNLEPGSPFIFSSGEKSFKNMVLIYASDSRCVVEGYKNDNWGDSSWSSFRDNCAPDAEVVLDESRKNSKIVQNSSGEYKIVLDGDLKKMDNVKTMKEETELNELNELNEGAGKEKVDGDSATAALPARRGRKRSAPKIAFPADREFTAPEIIANLGIQPYVVSNELNKALKEGRIQVVGGTPSLKGRGRHCKVFKVVGN
jgi:hypothetical protein